MNWIMARIQQIFAPHQHTWRRARKGEDQAMKYCKRCPATSVVKKRGKSAVAF